MPSDTPQTSAQLLAHHHIPANATRIAVLDLLQDSPQRHLNAEQLCAAMLRRQDGHAISSFRRAIYDLAAAGVLSRVVVPDEKNRTMTFYELANQPVHRHLYCTRCANLSEIFDEGLERAIAARFLSSGLQPANVDLALVGQCADCCRHAAPRQAAVPHGLVSG